VENATFSGEKHKHENTTEHEPKHAIPRENLQHFFSGRGTTPTQIPSLMGFIIQGIRVKPPLRYLNQWTSFSCRPFNHYVHRCLI